MRFKTEAVDRFNILIKPTFKRIYILKERHFLGLSIILLNEHVLNTWLTNCSGKQQLKDIKIVTHTLVQDDELVEALTQWKVWLYLNHFDKHSHIYNWYFTKAFHCFSLFIFTLNLKDKHFTKYFKKHTWNTPTSFVWGCS